MNSKNRFNGQRLKAARRYRKMTVSDIAEESGISKQAISQFENNKTEPKTETVFKLVKALEFPMGYFYQESPHNISEGDIYFRALASTTVKEKMAQAEHIKLLVDVYKGIEKYIEFPELNIYEASYIDTIDVEELAKEVRNYWGINSVGISNLIDVMEQNGIVVNTICTDNEKIDAYSQILQIEGVSLAVVVLGDDKESSYRRNFSVAHELGHLLLDDHYNISDMTKVEYKEMEDVMNRFAGALLIPKDAYLKDLSIGHVTDLDYYIQLKKKYNVSAAALIVRAKHLDKITNNQYQYLMRRLNQRGYRHCEPFDRETPLIKPRYLEEAMKMIIEEDGITSVEFLSTLEKAGCILSSEIVETVLNLEKGYLHKNDVSSEVIRLERKN